MQWHDNLNRSDFIDLILLKDMKSFGAADLARIWETNKDCVSAPKDVVS